MRAESDSRHREASLLDHRVREWRERRTRLETREASAVARVGPVTAGVKTVGLPTPMHSRDPSASLGGLSSPLESDTRGAHVAETLPEFPNCHRCARGHSTRSPEGAGAPARRPGRRRRLAKCRHAPSKR